MNVLFITGWIGNKSLFLPIIELLNKNNISFLEFKNIKAENDILKAIHKSIKECNPNLIIAWSMGTLGLLKTLESEPNNKIKLILISPTRKFIKSNYKDFGWNSKVVDLMIKGLNSEHELIINRFCKNMLCENEYRYEEEMLKNINKSKFNVEDLQNGLLFLRNTIVSNLNKIENEALIIQGENDKICSLQEAMYINNNIKNSTFKVIAKCGHAPFVTKKNETKNIILNFLKEEE